MHTSSMTYATAFSIILKSARAREMKLTLALDEPEKKIVRKRYYLNAYELQFPICFAELELQFTSSLKFESYS